MTANPTKQMKTSRLSLVFVLITISVAFPVTRPCLAAPKAGSNEAEVRAVVEQVFENLKNKNYEALYDTLPSSTRSRLSRERFASALRRTQDSYALNRMEIGKVNVSGNIAVVGTVLYGRLLKPFDTEGKIVVQQYLVREEGKWRVATGDNATVKRFLSSNPAFARQFRIRPPRIFVKKDGTWVEFTPPKRQRQA